MYFAHLFSIFILVSLTLTSCGSKKKSKPPINPNSEHAEDKDSWKIRGRWQVNFQNNRTNLDEQLNAFTGTNSVTVISSTVPELINFNVSAASITPPVDPTEGDRSFGALKLDLLRDNKIKVCGSAGTSQCTEAILRIYTTGKPGSGLWSDADGFGLPISTNGHEIGLGIANSYTFASLNVSTLKIVKLSDFTSAATLDIPLTVNYDRAGAGTYSASVVVEYALR